MASRCGGNFSSGEIPLFLEKSSYFCSEVSSETIRCILCHSRNTFLQCWTTHWSLNCGKIPSAFAFISWVKILGSFHKAFVINECCCHIAGFRQWNLQTRNKFSSINAHISGLLVSAVENLQLLIELGGFTWRQWNYRSFSRDVITSKDLPKFLSLIIWHKRRHIYIYL